MTEEQIGKCRDFLFQMGYGWEFCAFATNEDVVETMKEQHPTSLELIKNTWIFNRR